MLNSHIGTPIKISFCKLHNLGYLFEHGCDVCEAEGLEKRILFPDGDELLVWIIGVLTNFDLLPNYEQWLGDDKKKGPDKKTVLPTKETYLLWLVGFVMNFDFAPNSDMWLGSNKYERIVFILPEAYETALKNGFPEAKIGAQSQL